MRIEAAECGQQAGFERAAVGRAVAHEFGRGHDRAAAGVVALVAQRRNVSLALLLHRHRRGANIAAARMLGMYLVHVMLGRTYSEVGAVFGRDRTTVAYACARIEDLRDDPRFDAEVAMLEDAIGGSAAAFGEPAHAAG